MVRQAQDERNQYVTVHPELVEGFNQRFPSSPIELPEIPPKLATEQFIEWAGLKQEMIEAVERHLDYWKVVSGYANTGTSHVDRPRSVVYPFRGETQLVSLPLDLIVNVNEKVVFNFQVNFVISSIKQDSVGFAKK